MRIPVSLSRAFDAEFDRLLGDTLVGLGWIPDLESLESSRFLSRSIAPHIRTLSTLFNRLDAEGVPQGRGLEPYWGKSSNAPHLRSAYVLGFLPPNLCRVAAVWSELARLGYRWPFGDRPLAAVEMGAGPGAGACGIAIGEKSASVGLPNHGRWALVEQDGPMLEFGQAFTESYFAQSGVGDWASRPFRSRVRWESDWLPRGAPKFQLWVASYFINETHLDPEATADRLLKHWDRHLEPRGLAVMVEPALKHQSRRLLEVRAAIVERIREEGLPYRVLLPCNGHQACGALAEPEDWCHDEVSWWRSPRLRELDAMAGLDRKTLHFSHLVIEKTRLDAKPSLLELGGESKGQWQRLVSPARKEGKWLDFYTCGPDGKERSRLVPIDEQEAIGRGDFIEVQADTEPRAERHVQRIPSVSRVR